MADDQLDRIEKLMLMILERVNRIEYRLETSGVFTDNETYRDAKLRHALEHGLPLPKREDNTISPEFVDRVDQWLAAHEDDPEARFMTLARDLSSDGGIGKEIWPDLIAILEHFYLCDMWESVIDRVCQDPHPLALKHLREHPYKDDI